MAARPGANAGWNGTGVVVVVVVGLYGGCCRCCAVAAACCAAARVAAQGSGDPSAPRNAGSAVCGDMAGTALIVLDRTSAGRGRDKLDRI